MSKITEIFFFHGGGGYEMNLEEKGESLFTSKSAVYKNIKMYLW